MTPPPSPPHITNIMRWGNKILSNAGIENAKNETNANKVSINPNFKN